MCSFVILQITTLKKCFKLHVLLWFFSSPLWENVLEHRSQEKFLPVCVLFWFFRSPLWENILEHRLQGKGFCQYVFFCQSLCGHFRKYFETLITKNDFSPVCVILCYFRLPLWENVLGHWSQWNDFSPVCGILWFFRWPFKKWFVTLITMKKFFTSMCSFVVLQVRTYRKCLWIWSQGKCSSLMCVILCTFSLQPWRNVLGHWLQEKGFSLVCVILCFFRF